MQQLPTGGLAAAPAARAPLGLANRDLSTSGPLQKPGPSQLTKTGSAGPLSFTQYHTGWMDKQEAAFKTWLNAVLVPSTVDEDGSNGGAAVDGLAARRLIARLRGLLWQLYSQDRELIRQDLILKLEQRIDGGQMKLKDEETIMKNVKEAAKARAVLGAYHPLWLRLGMEVVVGAVMDGADAPVAAADVAAFLRDRFLNEPQLAKQHPASSKGQGAALARLVVKRVLLLVALLDRAAAAPGLPSAAPLLFRRGSKLKSSASVLVELVQPRLLGEGDVLRSLGRLGYKVAYEQDPRRELDFTVSNMATDLRDGLRVCKLAALLTRRPALLESARLPADRRPVRMANLQLALDRFAVEGMPMSGMAHSAKGASVPLTAADLADGDREMTLCLLWRLILTFQLPQLISLSALRAEIWLVRAKGASMAGSPAAPGGGGGPLQLEEDVAGSDLVVALLEWTQAVCAHYGLEVHSFGACFGDGSVFCLLVHHYLGHAYISLKDVYTPPPGSSGPPGATHLEGARRNFALVQDVLQSLGGIPAMVSADDFAEHGHDEKGCILFTAFLCQRLLEISKEERAAMVIQRYWRKRHEDRPGTAREHLHRWIAAAVVVQRAVRAWQLRRGLERFAARRRVSVAAVVRLQALWRARLERQRYQQLRQAAICMQAIFRGRQARRAVFHTLVLPGVLEAGLQRKRDLETSRYEARLARAALKVQAQWRSCVQRRRFLQQRCAAVAIQGAVRSMQQRVRYQQQRQAAVAIQAAWRGRQVRKQMARLPAAAAAIQSAWRGWRERWRYQQLRAAAVAVQAAWRARQARLLLRQHKAARSIQAAWRGYAVRKQAEQQREAAIRIQAAWRSFAAQQAFQRQRRAALQLQAAWRCHAARARFLCCKKAAVSIQAAWRGFAVRRLLQRNQAALAIQRHVRGFLARRCLQRQHRAAEAIQGAFRMHLKRKRAAAMSTLKQQMAEMARLMQLYQQRTAASLRIQAAYRGHQGRKQYRILLAERAQQEQQRREREAAALAVIAPWAATFRARTWFLRVRRAVPLLQVWWRRQFARRQAAAVAIQAAWRRHAAQRQLQRSRQAVLVVQTTWRGYHVRQAHPSAKQLAGIRLRLAAAAVNAADAPHRSLGARTHAHLDALLASKHPASAIAALNGLALCTESVRECCDIVVAGGGLPALFGIVRGPCRSKEAAEALRVALACLANISRCRQHAHAVYSAEGVLGALADHLQQQRDKEEVFLAVVALWRVLVCRDQGRAQALARSPELLAKLEGVARLLALKQAGDQKYLTKLEQQKGSDASARQATKALLATSRQLRALRAVLAATGASAEGEEGQGEGQGLVLGKNTLVRAVLREQNR